MNRRNFFKRSAAALSGAVALIDPMRLGRAIDLRNQAAAPRIWPDLTSDAIRGSTYKIVDAINRERWISI